MNVKTNTPSPMSGKGNDVRLSFVEYTAIPYPTAAAILSTKLIFKNLRKNGMHDLNSMTAMLF